MASLGVRTLDELIGRTDLLEADDGDRALEGARRRPHAASSHRPSVPEGAPRRRVEPPPPVLDDALDWELLEQARAGDRATASRVELEHARPQRQPLRRRHALEPRSPRAHGAEGLPEDTIEVDFTRLGRPELRRLAGAGRDASRCTATPTTTPARACRGGVARRAAARRRRRSRAEENVIVGNTVLYGATERQGVLPRPAPASASRCATRARARSSRASATTAAST